MVTPRDVSRQDRKRKASKAVRKPDERRRIRNQPLKGDPMLFALKKQLEKENGK